VVGGLFHMVNHSVFKSLLFLNAGAVEQACGTRDLRRLGGLGGRMPLTAATSMTASLSIAGIPPFNGFWSKLIIVLACVQAGFPVLALWAVLVSLITLASFMKVQRYAFFEELPAALAGVRRCPPCMAAAMILLACACLVMSLLVVRGLETPLLIAPAADVLMEGVFPLPEVL
jgi:multicomponent Na+:H+ antiporter subunit D